MKKITILLVCLMAIVHSEAQIKDTDAKLQFQEATDAYETTDYYKASKICEDLKDKMGRWTPKVLYLFLGSIYKNYTETQQNNEARYDTSYKQFKSFKDLSDSFFLLIDKNNYPKEKYAAIETTQQYFAKMMEKYVFQSTRTPEKALAFLNDCAKRFPNPSAGGEVRNWEYPNGFYFEHNINFGATSYIYFDICNNKFFHIVALSKTNGWSDAGRVDKIDKKLNFVEVTNDLIDLRHLPKIDDSTTINDNSVYYKFNHYRGINKDFIIKLDTSVMPFSLNDEALKTATGIKNQERFKYYFEFPYLKKDENILGRIIISEYPILAFFDCNNADFKAGNYAKRIKEAFDFIINYYPKEKLQIKQKKEEKKANDFGF